MKRLMILTAMGMLAVPVVADNIRGIDMDFITVGHAGNAADTEGSPGYGAVSYDYRIGKYEITNGQWNAFVAIAGKPTGEPSGAYDDNAYYVESLQPTDGVSWYEAAQFCNFLTSGNKSQGAYRFSGNNSNPGTFLGIDRYSAISTYGVAYVIPTEDEWYKAAYYKPDGSGYSAYANGTEVAPTAGVQSNYSNAMTAPWNVGNGMQEQNGTYEMMGNAWEWSETQWQDGFINCIIRGGSFTSNDHALSKSGPLYDYDPQEGRYEIGFRVAFIPEPCTLLLLGLGGLLIGRR